MRNLLSLFILSLLLSTFAFSQTKANIEFEKYHLENGLTVILSPDQSSPIVAIDVWYKVGAKDEEIGKTGLSSLAGQLMFAGSEHVEKGKHRQFVSELGGVARSRITLDQSEFYQTVPSNATQLVLWLESDRMNSLSRSINEDEFQMLREKVLKHKQSQDANRSRNWRTELFTLSYSEDYPYHRDATGFEEDIAELEYDDIVAFIEKYYTPNNAILSIVGDIEIAQTKHWVESYFGDIKPGPQKDKMDFDFPGFNGGKIKQLESDNDVEMVFYNFPFKKMGISETYAMDLVAQILGSGESSRLYQRLAKDEQLASSVEISPWSMELNSHLLIIIEAAQGVSAEELHMKLDERLAKCRDNPFTPEEVERAKNKLKIFLTEWVNTNEGKGFLFGAFEALLDNPDLIAKELFKYDDISVEEVNAVFNKYVVKENSNILLYTRKK